MTGFVGKGGGSGVEDWEEEEEDGREEGGGGGRGPRKARDAGSSWELGWGGGGFVPELFSGS